MLPISLVARSLARRRAALAWPRAHRQAPWRPRMIRTASYPSLEARTAFVTGGGSGIGASIVEHLCAQRARGAFVDIERAASQALVETIRARGHPAPVF